MTLTEKLIEAYPELADMKLFMNETIWLRNDSDGTGDYIKEWNYSKPIPNDLKEYLRA